MRFDFASDITNDQKDMIYQQMFGLSTPTSNLLSKIRYFLGRIWVRLSGDQPKDMENNIPSLTIEQKEVIFKCIKVNPNWTQKHRKYVQVLREETQSSFQDSIIKSNLDVFNKIYGMIQNGLIDKSICKPQYVNINSLDYATRYPNESILKAIVALKDDKDAPLYDRNNHLAGIRNIISSNDPISHLPIFKETLDSLSEDEIKSIFKEVLSKEKSVAEELCKLDWMKKWTDKPEFLRSSYAILLNEEQDELRRRSGIGISGRALILGDDTCQKRFETFKQIFIKNTP